MVTAFTIKRSEWFRGNTSAGSHLLREQDGKRCCVGIYARTLGVPDAHISGFGWPSPSKFHPHIHPCPWDVSNTEASWLIGHTRLAAVNDDQQLAEDVRETEIAALFAKQGITVTFED